MKFYERVISDFGGYEKCKDILSQPNIDFIMNAQGLREHMLEYRRQHNIFEVGDKVFCEHFEMDEVKNILTVEIVRGHYLQLSDGVSCTAHLVRHATDEEIEAGKRLEVNQ